MSWIITSLIVTGVAAGASAYGSYQQTKEIKKGASKQEDSARALAEDEKKNKLQTMMRMQKKKGAVGEPGLRDTILTGSLGVPGQPQTANKTLLGL